VKKAHRKSGIGDSNHQNIAGFKTPIEVTPIEGRETLKSFLWEEKFPDREIGEFQETEVLKPEKHRARQSSENL
jgi:hypothetical protein